MAMVDRRNIPETLLRLSIDRYIQLAKTTGMLDRYSLVTEEFDTNKLRYMSTYPYVRIALAVASSKETLICKTQSANLS